jgi:CheY-like chemotaxis protein
VSVMVRVGCGANYFPPRPMGKKRREQALSTGAIAFLDKPFSDELLLSAAGSALQS